MPNARDHILDPFGHHQARALAGSVLAVPAVAVRVSVLRGARAPYAAAFLDRLLRDIDQLLRGEVMSGIGEQPAEVVHPDGVAQPDHRAPERNRPIVAFFAEHVCARTVAYHYWFRKAVQRQEAKHVGLQPRIPSRRCDLVEDSEGVLEFLERLASLRSGEERLGPV